MCLIALFFIGLFGFSLAHPHELGNDNSTSCPDLKEFKNLSIDKIIGVWFVVYALEPTNPCVFWNISRNPNNTNQLVLQEKQIILLTDSAGIKLKQFVEGDKQILDIPDPAHPSNMIIRRPTSLPNKIDHFVIFDTDYDNYLATYECDELVDGDGFLHRRGVTILSKKILHDEPVLNRIERVLSRAGVENSLIKVNRKVDDSCEFYSPHYYGPSPTDRSLNIKNGDMPDIMMIQAIGAAREAFDVHRKNGDIANYIKKKFDQSHNGTWNCLVGLNFDGTVSYKLGTLIHFTRGKHNVLLFQSPVEV